MATASQAHSILTIDADTLHNLNIPIEAVLLVQLSPWIKSTEFNLQLPLEINAEELRALCYNDGSSASLKKNEAGFRIWTSELQTACKQRLDYAKNPSIWNTLTQIAKKSELAHILGEKLGLPPSLAAVGATPNPGFSGTLGDGRYKSSHAPINMIIYHCYLQAPETTAQWVLETVTAIANYISTSFISATSPPTLGSSLADTGRIQRARASSPPTTRTPNTDTFQKSLGPSAPAAPLPSIPSTPSRNVLPIKSNNAGLGGEGDVPVDDNVGLQGGLYPLPNWKDVLDCSPLTPLPPTPLAGEPSQRRVIRAHVEGSLGLDINSPLARKTMGKKTASSLSDFSKSQRRRSKPTKTADTLLSVPVNSHPQPIARSKSKRSRQQRDAEETPRDSFFAGPSGSTRVPLMDLKAVPEELDGPAPSRQAKKARVSRIPRPPTRASARLSKKTGEGMRESRNKRELEPEVLY